MSTDIPREHLEYRDALTVPDGYHLSYGGEFGWLLAREDVNLVFQLTDRTFGDLEQTPPEQDTSDIDYWTGHAISRSIEAIIAEKGRAVVLDVACGPLNKAAYQIAEKYGDQVEVKAVDLCGSTMAYTRSNLERRTGSALTLPYGDGSIDMVYSFQFLTKISVNELRVAFGEILRVMGDNSQAVLGILNTDGLYTNTWLNRYRRPSWIPETAITFEDPFDIHEKPWDYSGEDFNLHFRPVTEFNQTKSGGAVLGNWGLTPFLHITKGSK